MIIYDNVSNIESVSLNSCKRDLEYTIVNSYRNTPIIRKSRKYEKSVDLEQISEDAKIFLYGDERFITCLLLYRGSLSSYKDEFFDEEESYIDYEYYTKEVKNIVNGSNTMDNMDGMHGFKFLDFKVSEDALSFSSFDKYYYSPDDINHNNIIATVTEIHILGYEVNVYEET